MVPGAPQLEKGRASTVFDRSRLDRYRDVEGQSIYNHYSGHDVGADPYAAFASMRAEAPVLHCDLHETLSIDPEEIGVTIAAPGYRDVPRDQLYSAVAFESVSHVLRSEHYDSSAILRAHFPSLGRTIISMDGPEHRMHRAIVAAPFKRKALEEWTSEVVTRAAKVGVEELLRTAKNSDGHVDLLKSFSWEYPARVMGDILGLNAEDAQTFKYAALAMATFARPDLAIPAGQVVYDWIEVLSAETREQPPNESLLSKLVHAEMDGHRLTTEEVASLVRLLFVGGFETTVKGLSNVLVGLLTSGQWGLVRDERSLLPNAVEEGLRWETRRSACPGSRQRDQELFGIPIPKGAAVLCFLGSANRDESRWTEPDQFDARREIKQHATFGFGPHICIGMHLARAEITTALDLLLDIAPDLVVAPGGEVPMQIRGLASRGPEAIPVLLSR
jgi:cytochrome P450